MNRLYLLRHCAPLMPEGHCIGNGTDLPLSPEGEQQAMELARTFGSVAVDKAFCSRLVRSRRTAEILSNGRFPVEELCGLDELGVGLWENMSFADIRRDFPEEYAARGLDMSIPPPGGESICKAAVRMEAALGWAMECATGDVLAIGHAGVNRAFLCNILKMDMKNYRSIPQPYGCVNVILYDAGSWRVETVGLSAEEFLKGKDR